MDKYYSFFKDDLAVLEIRKHQWIESEKRGEAIGFASAALDWIKKYGPAFQQYRLGMTGQNLLSEKRRHRRFSVRFPVQIKVNNANITCHTDDVSLMGLSCTIPEFVPNNTPTEVTIRFQQEFGQSLASHFEFLSRVVRVTQPASSTIRGAYNIFVPFPESVRDYIRANAQALAN